MASLEFAGLVAMLAPCWHMYNNIPRDDVKTEVLWALVTGALLYPVTWFLIPRLAVFTQKAGLKGRDLCKKGTPAGEIDM